MALQNAGISFQIVDGQGVNATHTVYVQTDSAQTVTQIIASVQTYGDALDNMTDGQIMSVEYKLVVPIGPGWKVAPVTPGSNVGDNGQFNYAISGLSKRSYSFNIPAIAKAVIVGSKIDLTNAHVVAWQSLIPAGIAAMNFFTEVYQALGTFRRSRLTTRKHRRSETLESNEV